VIGILKQLKGCPPPELLGEPLYKLRVRKRITSPLQEQHRNFHLEQMISTLIRWSPGGMKRESEED
jgi:hypothetical protein